MKIEFNDEVEFSSLYAGDFFIDDCGRICIKIPEEDEHNAVCLNDVQAGDPALYYYPNSCKCRKCEGKIVIY